MSQRMSLIGAAEPRAVFSALRARRGAAAYANIFDRVACEDAVGAVMHTALPAESAASIEKRPGGQPLGVRSHAEGSFAQLRRDV